MRDEGFLLLYTNGTNYIVLCSMTCLKSVSGGNIVINNIFLKSIKLIFSVLFLCTNTTLLCNESDVVHNNIPALLNTKKLIQA